MRNKANTYLDEAVAEYKKNRTHENFKIVFDKLKWYIEAKIYDDETRSDAYWILNKSIDTWDQSKNVYFLHYFKICFGRFRKEMYQYRNCQVRKAEKTISLNATIETSDGEGMICEIIEDVKWNQKWEQIQNENMFMDFLEKNVEDQQDKKILEIMYKEPNLFQSEIAEKIGVSQVMIHKRIKRFQTRKYAKELYELLKGNI